jgi:hypothetical protein
MISSHGFREACRAGDGNRVVLYVNPDDLLEAGLRSPGLISRWLHGRPQRAAIERRHAR